LCYVKERGRKKRRKGPEKREYRVERRSKREE